MASESVRAAPGQRSYTIRVIGVRRAGFRDAYHALLRMPWWAAIAIIVVAYLLLNAVFAALYLVAGGVANARPGSFLDAFYFSVQTMGTIGYGSMFPVSGPANAIMVAESIVGLIVTALATGLIFGLSPALQAARADLNAVMKHSSGRTGTGFRRNRSRAILVVTEIGLAVVLMVGSALLIRSFVRVLDVDTLPTGPGWQYEPKWDGFRCLVFRNGRSVELQSKSGQSLTRYFPEVVEAVRSVPANAFVLDGEIVIPVDGQLSFDDLLQRIHPAESRVKKLSAERPALLVVFDMLADTGRHALVDRPLRERRPLLEAFAKKELAGVKGFRLSPATTDAKAARAWLSMTGGTFDGVVAKRLDLEYRSGDRTGMQKVKRLRTVDCVVGGFRYASKSRVVGSLLLGLYDAKGLLHHVGFTSGFSAAERKDLPFFIDRAADATTVPRRRSAEPT